MSAYGGKKSKSVKFFYNKEFLLKVTNFHKLQISVQFELEAILPVSDPFHVVQFTGNLSQLFWIVERWP